MLKNLFIIILLSLTTISVVQADVQINEPKEIRIGVILSLSGGLEQWCKYIKQGIELAAAENGLINVRLFFEDDRSVDKKSALTAAYKLINHDQVDLIFTWTPSTISVLTDVVSKAKIPLIVGAYNTKVEKAGPYVFGAFVNYKIAPRQIAKFFVEGRSAKRIALLMASDDWSQGFEAPFKEELGELGKELVLSETVSPDEKDFRAIILKFKKHQVDAVLAPLYGQALYSFLKQAQELKFSAIIHVADGMFEGDLKVAGNSAEGVYASQIWLDSTELKQALINRYNLTVNPLQLGIIATGYDWLMHVRKAAEEISKSSKISPAAIHNKLLTYKSSGYLGPLTLGAAPISSGEVTVRVSNNKFELVE